MKRLVVGVMCTQSGATFATFDRQRFETEVVAPVRHFLTKVSEARIVLIFYGGVAPEAEEAMDDPRAEEGLPHHKKTPCSVAALAAFGKERAIGRIDLLVLTDERPLAAHTSFVRAYLEQGGGVDAHILPVDRLPDLEEEVNARLLA